METAIGLARSIACGDLGGAKLLLRSLSHEQTGVTLALGVLFSEAVIRGARTVGVSEEEAWQHWLDFAERYPPGGAASSPEPPQ